MGELARASRIPGPPTGVPQPHQTAATNACRSGQAQLAISGVAGNAITGRDRWPRANSGRIHRHPTLHLRQHVPMPAMGNGAVEKRPGPAAAADRAAARACPPGAHNPIVAQPPPPPWWASDRRSGHPNAVMGANLTCRCLPIRLSFFTSPSQRPLTCLPCRIAPTSWRPS